MNAELGTSVQDFLHALASEARQQILMLFVSGGEHTVGEVADRLGIAQSTASQHLSILRRGGVFSSRRDGKAVFYRADVAGISGALDELQSYLRSCCPVELTASSTSKMD